MFYFIIGLIGMCLASFVNVVVYRLPKHEDFIYGHSYCPYCYHDLSILDMIPVLSYLYLRGKCRYCHHHIPIRDTLIEILGGFISMLCFFCFWSIYDVYYCIIISFYLYCYIIIGL